MSDSQTYHEMSDNRYTLRLKPQQKEWVDKNQDAADRIRNFIDSQILASDNVDMFDVLKIMQSNRDKTRAIEEEWLFKRVTEVLSNNEIHHLTEPGHWTCTLELLDIDNKQLVDKRVPINSYGQTQTIKVWATIKFQEQDVQKALDYVDRCRRIRDGFISEIERLKAENQRLESKICQTNTIVSDSLTQNNPTLKNELEGSLSFTPSALPMLSFAEQRLF